MNGPADDTRGPRRRAPRGCVLLVGAIDEPLAPHLSVEPVCVADLFAAIGEITTSRADRPIVAALIDDRLLSDQAAAAALRRIDPTVRLLTVSTEDVGRSGGRPADGFDAHVPLPIDHATLRAALGADWLVQDAEPENGATPAPTPHQTESPSPQPPTPVLVPVAAPIPTPPPTPRSVPATSPAPGTPNAPASEPLGDTDLVNAVLQDPDGVASASLALIRQHTGWTMIDLLDADADIPGGLISTPVQFEDRTFGHLVTGEGATGEEDQPLSPADADELEPWARWLGHWLALDARYREYRVLAYHDDLTGTWNRRYYTRFMADVIARARERRRFITVMVFDIDDFKRYNDNYGHEAGDVILCETVALLDSVIRDCDRVCRIGGDEFAVIFADLDDPRESGSRHPESVETIARRFQEQIRTMRFPKLGLEAPGPLSISAGLATFPWDGQDGATLLRLADERSLESKRNGKNSITFGPGGVGD